MRTLIPPTPSEDLPPAPPTPQDVNIPDEAYGARTAFGLLDPGERLDPGYWDEAARANSTRAAELQNQFLDRQRQILHTGPDAFLGKTGRDAVLAAPDVLGQLDTLRQATLDQAGNDAQRQLLGEALSNHAIAEHATVGAHAGEQSLAWQNQTATERLNQLNQQAAVDYGDPGAIEAYDRASDSAARERARTLNYAPDSDRAQAEVDTARSTVWRSAIQSALDKWDLRPAVDLHTQAGDRLNDADAVVLGPQIDAATEYQAGQDYLRTLPMPATQDLDALDQAHQAATTQNTTDWPDNDSQRATNQHLIDIAFGQRKQDAQQAKAGLDQTVNDWLNQPGQTQRPPLSEWVRLDPEQQRAADLRLAQNAVPTETQDNQENGKIAQVDEIPPRIFRIPIPRQSGKEGAKDTPSWSKGQKPYVGETPEESATRIMDKQYGKGNWEKNPDRLEEFGKLQKNFSRHYQDPKDIIPPSEGPFRMPGEEWVVDAEPPNTQSSVASL